MSGTSSQPLELALRYAEHGVRAALVVSVTGLPRSQVRWAWRKVWGRGPFSGQLPTTGVRRLLTGSGARREAAAFATAYLVSRPGAALGPYHLLTIYERYRAARRASPPVSLEHAWFIAQDLHKGYMRMRACRGCAMPLLRVREGAQTPRHAKLGDSDVCPVCGKSADAAAKASAKGHVDKRRAG